MSIKTYNTSNINTFPFEISKLHRSVAAPVAPAQGVTGTTKSMPRGDTPLQGRGHRGLRPLCRHALAAGFVRAGRPYYISPVLI